MANPQTENGFTKIANELYDELIKQPLTGAEIKVFLYVVRKTYGFNKKEDKIPLSQFQGALKLSRQTVCNCVNRLVKAGLLATTKKPRQITCYRVEKDYEKWVVKPGLLVKSSSIASQKRFTQLVKPALHSKEISSKEIIQKKEKNDKIVKQLDKLKEGLADKLGWPS